MADLVYKIGADVTDLEKGVAKAESALKDVGGTINKTVTPAINTSNQALQSFDKTIKQTSSELNTIKPAAVNGANALNSIGQVTRDLPFGFIAIQNNLPQVVDSFGSLAKQAGGTLPALKALGASLIGPAGISFAFGAVIAGVTALIQKYGSFGEAINNLLGGSKALTANQKLLSEESTKAAGNLFVEEAKIKSLSSAILSSSTPRDKQLAYYNELKKINPDIVSGISAENLGTKEGNNLLTANIALRNKLVSFKIQEAGISAVLTKNAEDLATARENERKATINLTSAEKEFQANRNQSVNAPGAQAITTYANRVKDARIALNESSKAVKDLISVQNNYLSQLNPITKEVAQINEVTKKQTEALKKQIDTDKKATQETSKRTASIKAYKYELQSLSEFKLNPEQLDVKNQIERLQELANVVLNVKASEEKRLAALNELKAIEPALFKGLDLQSKNYDKLKASIDVTNEGYLLQLSYLNSIAKASDKIQPQRPVANITPTAANPIVAPTALPAAIDEFLQKQNLAKQALIDFRKQANLSAAYNLLNDTFFSPIQDLFSNFLETGKFAMADFGKAVLKAINQIVAKIIATGIISLLFTLFTGGFGAAAGGAAGGFKQVLGAIGGSLGFSGGKVAAPSFAGVGGGSLGMSGQVNVVLRGSDLVGSINRTNATINRVG